MQRSAKPLKLVQVQWGARDISVRISTCALEAYRRGLSPLCPSSVNSVVECSLYTREVTRAIRVRSIVSWVVIK